MKKVVVMMALVFGMIFGATAQNRSIHFEDSRVWKKIVQKAKKEKKLIFIDCYTDWCGPCKTLAANVFTQDMVADYFNGNLVNAKFEMEKDADGIMLKNKYGIAAYPTLLFIDPKTEEVVHRLVGAGSANWLIAGAKQAGDPSTNLKAMDARYAAGERDVDFLNLYLKTLGAAYMKDEQGKVATEYLNALSEEQLLTKENWDLLKDNINDPLSKPMRSVMANRAKFHAIAGQEVVDHKLGTAIQQAASGLSMRRSTEKEPFDEARNAELKSYLLSIDFEGVPTALAYLYTAEYARKGDYRGVLDNMREVYKYNLFRGTSDRMYFQFFIESLGNSGDKALVAEGVKWIDKRAADTNDVFYKATLMGSKARILTAIGDTLGADKAKLDEEKYNTEGESRSGGRMIRAIRMQ